MALITDSTGALGLQIVPITPAANAPRDAYELSVYNRDTVVFEMRFSYYGKQMGHYYVRQLARAFRNAGRLLDANCGFGIGDSADPEFYEPAYACAAADWVRVQLYGLTKSGKTMSGARWTEPRIYITVYLFNAPDFVVDSSYLTPCMVLPEFYCHPDVCERFGVELMTELRDASRKRAELGIMAPDEIVDADYGVP